MSVGEGTASLGKALAVLEHVGAVPGGIGNAELLESAGLPKTTLYRILATLVERGLVRRDPVRKTYRLGFRYLELVRSAYLMPDLVAAASIELRSLRDLTGETAYLAILEGSAVLALERCDGAHSQRSSAQLGQSKPVYCTGQGKAILSRLGESEADAVLKSVVLEPLTPYTIVDRRRLNIELGITRARGFAIDDEEIVLGVRCVAAPIVDAAGQVRGALSVAGPAYRLSRARLELLGPELAEAARRVGAQLSVRRHDTVEETVTPVSDNWAFHGAFPCWSGATRSLYWADTVAPAVHCFDGQRDRIVATPDAPITAMQLCGETLFIGHDGYHETIGRDGVVRRVTGASAWNDPAVRALCTDQTGVCWAVSTTTSQAAGGDGCEVGTIGDDGRFAAHWRFAEPIGAMAWANDGTTAYATAPVSGTLYYLQRDVSTLRRLTSMPTGAGRMAGVAVDAQDGIWIALADGWSVVRFSSEGNVDRVLSLPVSSPTGLAIVAGDGATPCLFVTSDRHLLPLDVLTRAPWSGRLLRIGIAAGEH